MTDPISSHREASDDRTALRWLFSFVRPLARRLALVVLVALVSTALVLLQPLLTKLLIDDGILAGDHLVSTLHLGAAAATAEHGGCEPPARPTLRDRRRAPTWAL